MQIIFKKTFLDTCNIPFGIYHYNERIAQEPSYIDLRGIVQERTSAWLDDLHFSHSRLSELFSRYTRWWWVTAASRLDGRPWGQEELIKPLFFARALVEWITRHPDIHQIFLFGCDPMVAIYLRDFKKDITIEGDVNLFNYLNVFLKACTYTLLGIAKMVRSAISILFYHVFRRPPSVYANTLILYELFFKRSSLNQTRDYYYGFLFENIDKEKIQYGCIETSTCSIFKLYQEVDNKNFLLLDALGLKDFIWGVCVNTYLLFVAWLVVSRRASCSLGKLHSVWFWFVFLFHELSKTEILNALCAYRALMCILQRSNLRTVGYPYEEKGTERAILFACSQKDVKTIGYAPHPQHRLALALRDTYKPDVLRPSRHAVCGLSYVDYFSSWAKKKPDTIIVWGSAKKVTKTKILHNTLKRERLTILLLISHPNELAVFRSWLNAEPRLVSNTTYLLRNYRSVQNKKFLQESTALFSDFNCVREVNGTLCQDLDQCDIAAFCATSAGVVAAQYGWLAVYISLNDLFSINPCFDELSAMLGCLSATQFSERLDQICAMDKSSLSELYQRQFGLAQRIFSPICYETIKKELLC